jgi:hypothetical protein
LRWILKVREGRGEFGSMDRMDWRASDSAEDARADVSGV